MAPPVPNLWTTHPEYIDLLNYVIERTKDAKLPMNIHSLAREFKEERGAEQTSTCFENRIYKLRTRIHTLRVDTNTKVKLLFALSASVDANFLKKMSKDAFVEFDNKKRITHFKAKDGSLELRGDHSRSEKNKTAQLGSKRSLRSLIINYFETKGDADAIPKNKEEKEMGKLIEFITENCVNVDTPLSIRQLAKDFKNRFGISIPLETVRTRVKGYCWDIQKVECLDTNTKVQQLFCLSATVDLNCLKELRKNAQVEVDEMNRITYYKATNGSLELRGNHHLSAKIKTAKLESKGSPRSMINSYFENKNNSDAVPENEAEKGMWNLIEFITEKCQSVDTPLHIHQLTKDFIQRFESPVPLETIRKRIRRYGREIQKMDYLDTLTKVKQLFCISASVDSDYLEKLRKDAIVEVDDMNRITKYTANDGHLNMCGEHSSRAKGKLAGIVGRKRKNTVMKHSNSGGDENEESENENGYSEDDSDEYSSEEFGSEFDSDDENDPLDEADHMDSSNELLGYDNETSIRNRSASEMSIDDNFDIDPPTHRSEEIERGADEDNDFETTGNESVKTRSGRLSKKRHLNSKVSYNQTNSSSSEVPMSSDSLSPKSAKQEKSAIQKEQAPRSSNQSRSSSRSMRRSTRNSSFPSISTNSEENMENQDASRAIDFESETSIRAPSPIDNDYDFDPPTERIPRPEETGLGEDGEKENNSGTTANSSVKTRSGRLSKRRHLDSGVSYNLTNSRTSATPRSTVSSSTKPAKQKKVAIEREQASSSSNQSTSSSRQLGRSIGSAPSPSFSTESERIGNQDAPEADENPSDYPGPRIQEMDDYDYNPREDNLDISPIDNQIEEPNPQATEEHNTNNQVQNTDKRSDVVAPEPKPEKESLTLQNNQNSTPQMNGNEFVSIESHIRFLESLIPMMTTLDTPTLEEDQLRIEKTIEKFKEIGNEEEKIRLNEIRTSLMTCLLIVERSAKKEIVKREDTTSLKEFLLTFHHFLVALRMKELESFVTRVKHMLKELKANDKKFPTKKIQLALQSIIEIIAP